MVNTSIILPKVNETVAVVSAHVTNTVTQNIAPVFTPDQAPLWLNILIYMQMYQWELLAAILPTIYLVIVKLFGFPLLQRWSQEVVIILYPTKAKFYKLVTEDQPYFSVKNGVYWRSNPLINVNNQPHKFMGKKGDKSKICHAEVIIDNQPALCGMTKKEHAKIQNNIEQNYNTLQIFTHAINQSVYDMKRRDSKTDELTNSDHKLKPAPRHGIWIMRNFLQHFHRHWEIIIDPNGTLYELRAVKQRQQFSISLWHTLGVTQLHIKQVEDNTQEIESATGGNNARQQLVTVPITNQFVVSQIKFVKAYQNFSANAAYRICKRMKKIEANFYYWASGSFNMVPIIVVIGAMACVGLVFYMFMGGNHSLGPMPK